MIAGLQPPSVTPNPIHGAPVVLMEQGLAPGAARASSELTMMSLRDLIAENIELYQFCCLTGIIRPSPSDNVGSLSKINLRYRAWVTYLHIAFLLNCIVMLAYGIYALALIHEDRDNAISASEAFNILLQNLLVIPPVVYLRRELTTTREVNRHHYQEAFRYGMDIGKRVFKVLVVFLVVLTVDLVSYETWPTWLYEALLILLTFLPANAFLTGVFTFLVVELHITYQIIRETEQKVVARTLEHTEYLTTLKAIVQRERLYPINWLTSAAVLNTVLGMILMVIAQPNGIKAVDVFAGCVYILTTFGRQTLVLLLILYEMAKVNSINDDMLAYLAEDLWPDAYDKRYNLYILLKQCPMGSTMFNYRPSKMALFLQMGSTIAGVAAAVFFSFTLG